MMFVSTTTISLSHSVATFGNSSLDVFRCWDESAAQLHRFGSFRRAHFADGHAFADKVGDRVLKFSMFVYSANLDFAHQLVRQIKRRFHFARFPESWFSVNREKVLRTKVSQLRLARVHGSAFATVSIHEQGQHYSENCARVSKEGDSRFRHWLPRSSTVASAIQRDWRVTPFLPVDRKNLPFPHDLTRDGESASSRRNRRPAIACDPNKVITLAS